MNIIEREMSCASYENPITSNEMDFEDAQKCIVLRDRLFEYSQTNFMMGMKSPQI